MKKISDAPARRRAVLYGNIDDLRGALLLIAGGYGDGAERLLRDASPGVPVRLTDDGGRFEADVFPGDDGALIFNGGPLSALSALCVVCSAVFRGSPRVDATLPDVETEVPRTVLSRPRWSDEFSRACGDTVREAFAHPASEDGWRGDFNAAQFLIKRRGGSFLAEMYALFAAESAAKRGMTEASAWFSEQAGTVVTPPPP